MREKAKKIQYNPRKEEDMCNVVQKNKKTCKGPITCKKKGHQEKRLDPNIQNNGEEKRKIDEIIEDDSIEGTKRRKKSNVPETTRNEIVTTQQK